MASQKLKGKRVAILVADGFEQVEMTGPRQALLDAGATADIISPNKGKVQGLNHREKGDLFDVTVPLDQAHPDEYDALCLPGGVVNADLLRNIPKAVDFVRKFADAGKPIAAICHAPWILIEAGVARGKTMTSWPSLKTDLRNAGATWLDEEVVTDQGLVTSRKPDDILAFNEKMIEEFAEGKHAPMTQEAEQPFQNIQQSW